MPIAEPIADGYAIALEEARRALDEQERAVAQLSTRAGLLISAAAVVTSLLGGPVLAHAAFDIASWVAIAAFVGVAATVLAILSPRREWEFAIHPALLIGDYVERTPSPPAPLRRELALTMGASITHNRRALDRMMTTFNTGSVFLAIEILAWVVSIATSA
ncbi:MAG TPA: hypothetical protein VKB25_06475 [Conexibacter sp.]|nr:hypothetical protein [Conexibacter sp.]